MRRESRRRIRAPLDVAGVAPYCFVVEYPSAPSRSENIACLNQKTNKEIHTSYLADRSKIVPGFAHFPPLLHVINSFSSFKF